MLTLNIGAAYKTVEMPMNLPFYGFLTLFKWIFVPALKSSWASLVAAASLLLLGHSPRPAFLILPTKYQEPTSIQVSPSNRQSHRYLSF